MTKNCLIFAGLLGLAGCALLSRDIQPDATVAAQLANRETKRQHNVEPFSPDDFVPTRRGSEICLTATAPLGLDDVHAEVLFKRRQAPVLSLTILTSRVTPPKVHVFETQTQPETTIEIKDIRIEETK